VIKKRFTSGTGESAKGREGGNQLARELGIENTIK